MRYLRADDPPRSQVFVAHRFLDAASCELLRHECAGASVTPAYISGLGGTDLRDESRRRTQRVLVPKNIHDIVQERFSAITSALEGYFSRKLARVQFAQFLRYRRGDFFRPHQDSSIHHGHLPEVRLRSVSAVLFLNRQTRLPEPGAYCGGALTLFCVDNDPDPRLHIGGEEGLLVAFPSEVMHEVRPVTYGERYTVVTWYEKEGGQAD